MAEPANINEILDGHVVLDLECVDRIFLNAYVPRLQVGGQAVTFLTEHLGHPIPSHVGRRDSDLVIVVRVMGRWAHQPLSGVRSAVTGR